MHAQHIALANKTLSLSGSYLSLQTQLLAPPSLCIHCLTMHVLNFSLAKLFAVSKVGFPLCTIVSCLEVSLPPTLAPSNQPLLFIEVSVLGRCLLLEDVLFVPLHLGTGTSLLSLHPVRPSIIALISLNFNYVFTSLSFLAEQIFVQPVTPKNFLGLSTVSRTKQAFHNR